jgi:hypothetical protein
VAALVVLAAAGTVWASAAGFAIRGLDVELGKAEEPMENGKPLPPRFHVKVEKGRAFTLCAQGMVYPRGAKEQPGEPECGAWLFDDAAFKLMAHDKKQADNTKVLIRLQPTAVGRTRVRFVGEILGYAHTFDVMVEVVPERAK